MYDVEKPLQVLHEDLKARFHEAVREKDDVAKQRICDIIYNLEKVYPQMQRAYLHTFPGEKSSEH